MSRDSVGGYLERARSAGLSWPLPPELDDGALERLLFPTSGTVSKRPLPDWSEVHQELKHKGVTLALLWQEHKERHPEGYEYSWFCDRYRAWAGKLNLSMRQSHRAGEKTFVDYAGLTVPVVARETGKTREAQIFIAVLGASSYTYAEATWTQQLPDWINSHIRAFQYFGGVTDLVIPDNLKSAVSRACRYEPDINPDYHEMAMYYGTTVIPARARRPKDKAKAEAGVQLVERWILARLRKMTFFSLTDLNHAIRDLLADLNERPFRKMPGSRRSQYESLDKPVLKALPTHPYEYAGWKKARVNIDYHFEFDGHYYSVPYQLCGQEIDVRATQSTVECLHKSVRVASHVRSDEKGRHTTVVKHMPRNHREYAEWTPERLTRWANSIGIATGTLAEVIMSSREHPVQGFRSVLGILRLGKTYSDLRLEAACRRAIFIGSMSYKSVKAILKNGLDGKPLPQRREPEPAVIHANIRGPRYYREEGAEPC